MQKHGRDVRDLEGLFVDILKEMDFKNGELSNNISIRKFVSKMSLGDSEKATFLETILRFNRKGDMHVPDSRCAFIFGTFKQNPNIFFQDNSFPTEVVSTRGIENDLVIQKNLDNYNNSVMISFLKQHAVFVAQGDENPDFSLLLELAATNFLRVLCSDTSISRRTENMNKPDGGIDVLGNGVMGQCKFSAKSGVQEIRSFAGAAQQFEKHLLFFFGRDFTPEAKKFAASHDIFLNVCKIFAKDNQIGMYIQPLYYSNL